MTTTKVYIIESERGWGSKVEDVLDFPSPEAALQYCKDYNNKHNPPMKLTPDWYMYATLSPNGWIIR